MTPPLSLAGGEATIQRSESAPFAVSERTAFQQYPAMSDHGVSCFSGEIISADDKPVINLPNRPGLKRKKDDCGYWVRKLKSGDHEKDIYHNCGSLQCEVCAPGEMVDKARLIKQRFDHYEQAKCKENAVLIPGEARHVVSRQFIFTIAPSHQEELIARTLRDCGSWDNEYYHSLVIAEYNKAIKVSGLIGGVSFYHDARVKHATTGCTGSRGKHLIKIDAKIAGNMKEDDPSRMLYEHIRKQENWQDYYYLSTHFHALAFGKIIDVEEFEKLVPGWTYHNKGPVHDPGGFAMYSISHMPLMKSCKSITWFGRLSPAVLGKTELRTHEQVQVHPKTKLPWIVVESSHPEEVGMTWMVKVTDYLVYFRPDHKYDHCWYGNVKYPTVKIGEYDHCWYGNVSYPWTPPYKPDDDLPSEPVGFGCLGLWHERYMRE